MESSTTLTLEDVVEVPPVSTTKDVGLAQQS